MRGNRALSLCDLLCEPSTVAWGGRRRRRPAEPGWAYLCGVSSILCVRLAAAGGRAVLDVLKADQFLPAGLRGAVSFHGIADGYKAPPPHPRPSGVGGLGSESASAGGVSAAAQCPPPRTLVCHAEDDPFVPKEDLEACATVVSVPRPARTGEWGVQPTAWGGRLHLFFSSLVFGRMASPRTACLC
jgi:hypothetical protein